MLGIMNSVIRNATGGSARHETGFEKERRIREADRMDRARARDELRRRLYAKIQL